MKQISIIIPVYNAEKYIRECLKSIYKQGLQESSFEVIIVNDGSKDKSIDSIHDFTEKYRNLKIINQTNQGVSIARNNGLKAAQGAYVWFVDADDLLADSCLMRILEIAGKYALDILQVHYLKMYKSLPVIPMDSTNYCSSEPVIKSGAEAYVEDFNPKQGYAWRYIFRNDFLLENHIKFLEHITFCEDTLFSTSALLVARKVANTPITAYIYRQHEQSAIYTISKEKMMSLNVVIEQMYILSEKKHLDFQLKRKIKFCIFQQMSVLFWYLTHEPALYHQRKEIITNLKNKMPFFMQRHSLREFTFSLFYNFCPSFFIWLRYTFKIT